MSYRQHDQAIALAAIIQSAYLVDQIATTGSAPAEQVTPLVNSLFAFDADTASDIYGGPQNLQPGLELINKIIIGGDAGRYGAAIRYALGILVLQGKLDKQPELSKILYTRLQHAETRKNHFSNENNEIAHSLAAIYQDTISKFSYRLRINGDAKHLKVNQNADLIRALLLAGIRSAVLWRQSGGRRWQLFFGRKRLARSVNELLQH
jgi:high frequency lysogenization protein